jgi:hypothetical protein
MNKKDFWALILCNITTLLLIIEHLCGYELAIWALCIWSIISSIIHIGILRDYVHISVFVKEDYTK